MKAHEITLFLPSNNKTGLDAAVEEIMKGSFKIIVAGSVDEEYENCRGWEYRKGKYVYFAEGEQLTLEDKRDE